MWFNPYEALRVAGRTALADLAWQCLNKCSHGDLQRWLDSIQVLPEGDAIIDIDAVVPVLSKSVNDAELLHKCLFDLHPWRKGPLVLGGINIDTEWRSDWKWNRVAPHLDLVGQQVLDIGCGNGYFGLRMLAAGAKLVVGIDPTVVFVMQWLVMQKLGPGLNNFVLPMGIEQLPAGTGRFDSVFSMGVLYHRRDPLEHLQRLQQLTRPGGGIVLETLILDGGGENILEPKGRYARMRNVHVIPTLSVLRAWLKQAGLVGARVLDVSKTSVDEQRSTEWMTFESLRESLDGNDPSVTVEGYPAPVRAVLLVENVRA